MSPSEKRGTPLLVPEDECKHDGQRALLETDPRNEDSSWTTVYVICLLCGKKQTVGREVG